MEEEKHLARHLPKRLNNDMSAVAGKIVSLKAVKQVERQ